MNVSLGLCRAQHWFPMITVKYELINCGENVSFLSSFSFPFFFFARLAAPILSHRHGRMIAEICFTFPAQNHPAADVFPGTSTQGPPVGLQRGAGKVN